MFDEAAFLFKKISSGSCFLYMLPPCNSPVSVHSLHVFCCLAKHRNTLLPLLTEAAVSGCALRTALLLGAGRQRSRCTSHAPVPQH